MMDEEQEKRDRKAAARHLSRSLYTPKRRRKELRARVARGDKQHKGDHKAYLTTRRDQRNHRGITIDAWNMPVNDSSSMYGNRVFAVDFRGNKKKNQVHFADLGDAQFDCFNVSDCESDDSENTQHHIILPLYPMNNEKQIDALEGEI